MPKLKALGFGYMPEETKHHFLIKVPKDKNKKVEVYERFEWDEEQTQKSDLACKNLKVTISHHKWDLIKSRLEENFNIVLKSMNMYVSKFKTGNNPVERLLGNELVLLLWGIEDSDPSLIPEALKNWGGLSREERWWLFTMTNAVTGQADDKRGWRKAIRYALTENPVDEKNQQGRLMEMFYRNVD
jgi:hypothetical protein